MLLQRLGILETSHGPARPQAKAHALKLVTGNPGKRVFNENEPKPEPSLPSPPPHLDESAALARPVPAYALTKLLAKEAKARPAALAQAE